MLYLTLARALFACSRALFAVQVLQLPFRVLYFHFRVHHLQFASSNFHSACSICSSHALFSFSRALFAVHVLYFQFRALHLQFVRSNFDLIHVLYLQFAHSIFSFVCSIFSSCALFLVSRGLFAVRVLYLQFELYFPHAPFAARMLWFPFHMLQLQLARFNILAFCFTAPVLDRATARYCFCT